MRSSRATAVLLWSGAILALALLVLIWTLEAASSRAQSDTMHNCPAAGQWSIAVWDGQSGTAAADALDSCAGGAVDAAYSLDPQTGGWSRWFAANPDPPVSNLPPLNDKQGILALGSAPTATPTPTSTPTPTPTPTPAPTPNAIAGATYTGEHSGGGTVEIVVSSDGTSVDSFHFTHAPCGDGTFPSGEVNGPIAIQDDTFATGGETADLSLNGSFPSVGTAEGTLALHHRPSYPPCTSGTLNWSAMADASAP